MTDEQTKTLGRIQKLIKLATANPNEEEARSAAMAAVKLMVSAGVHVGFREETRGPAFGPAGAYSYRTRPVYQADPTRPDPYGPQQAEQSSINMEDVRRMWEDVLNKSGRRPFYPPFDPFKR